MKKILITIESQTLKLVYKNHKRIREDLINTNIISDNELIFGIDYLKNNIRIVTIFLKELCEMKNITNVLFDNNEISLLMIPFFKEIPIQKMTIKKDETLTYQICENLISCNFLKEINCYNIPSFMFEMLDNENIKIETRSEFFYISTFMQENHLEQYSKIYYKNTVIVPIPLTDEDKNDFEIFCKINRYLKIVKLKDYQKEDLIFILKTIKENHLKNVLIQLPGSKINAGSVELIKELNKTYKKEKLKCTLTYSEDYLKDNIFKQVILNTIKICGVIIFILVGSVIAYIGTRNYFSMKKVDAIQSNIKETIENQNKDEIIHPPNSELSIKNNYIASLLSINPDVVGWLKVNNTNIDYPVVKSSDNEFYLKNNLYKEYDINGWIYMDYRNNVEDLNQNTIIYGHNMYYSGIMFGTLHKAAQKNWYTNTDNLVISFNTMYETMNWQIFSIYRVNKTSDYLNTEFANDTDYQNFIDLLKKRSLTNFNIEVTPKDKILTLSTCTGDNQRFVIHAKLIQDKK